MNTNLVGAIGKTNENLQRIFDTLKDHKKDSQNKSDLTEDKSTARTKVDKSEKTHVTQLKNFWLNLKSPVPVLATEVTKLSLLLCKKPLPKVNEVQHILEVIEALALEIVNTCHQLPTSQGCCLRNSLLSWVESLGKCLLDFLMFWSEENSAQALGGYVLDACDSIITLPSNNLEAVNRILADEEGMLADALHEIEEEVKADRLAQIQGDETDNSTTWTNQDRELLPPCIGLVQTARATVKKIRKVLKTQGKCESLDNIAQLDAIAEAAQTLSPAVDDFVSAIYPPMIKSSVSSAALTVVTAVRQILELYQNSHCVVEADKSWLSFLLRAVDHNNNKVQPLLNP